MAQAIPDVVRHDDIPDYHDDQPRDRLITVHVETAESVEKDAE
jgi:hypothetical protein